MREMRLAQILKIAGATILTVFCLSPFCWMLIVSFGKNPDFLTAQTSYAFTLDNYMQLLTEPSTHLIRYLINSFIVSFVSSLAATLFASLSAYAVTRMRFPGRIVIPLVMLAFSMFPQISIVGYLFKLMTNLGWINTYPALIFPYITLGMPLALWIMLSYFSQLPADLDHAARIDGASRFQVLRRIILPLAVPGAFSALLLVFVYSFNEFLFALMLTADFRARTVPVGIALFQGLHGQIPYGHVMAAAAIATVPIIVIAAIFQKRVISGLTRGAIKG
jgi:multiple sugar transport system permease protein